MGENVIFLSPEDQMLIGSEFVDELPWSSYARKNVGYLFAVACGASVIWDSDENNSLKFWLRGASPDPRLEIWTYSHAKGARNRIFFLVPQKE